MLFTSWELGCRKSIGQKVDCMRHSVRRILQQSAVQQD